MSKRKRQKKKHGGNVLILITLIVLLVLALALVASAYFRPRDAREAPDEAPLSAEEAPRAPVPENDAAAVVAEGPVALQLDIVASIEKLDIVVCDEHGSAVPGYAFALELTRDDGSSHSVATDVNGRYYAEYLQGGTYTVTLTAPEGFIAPESAVCRVPERLAYVAIENLEEHVSVSDVSALPAEEVHSGVSAGTAISLYSADDELLLTDTIPYAFSSVVISCPEMTVGNSYRIEMRRSGFLYLNLLTYTYIVQNGHAHSGLMHAHGLSLRSVDFGRAVLTDRASSCSARQIPAARYRPKQQVLAPLHHSSLPTAPFHSIKMAARTAHTRPRHRTRAPHMSEALSRYSD